MENPVLLDDSNAILSQLQVPGIREEEARHLIFQLESLPVAKLDLAVLRQILGGYIETHRDSNDAADLHAVASAVRKLVLNTPAADTDSLAFLLEAGHRAAVSLEIELEIAKAVVWQQAAAPRAEPNASPVMAARLRELVETYANDRLLPRPKYGATALNAIIALLLMRGHCEAICSQLRKVQLTWFTEQVAQRARRLRDELLRERGECMQTMVVDLDAVATEFTKRA